jgi:serine/threonine protein phosphatase PrpC
MSDIFVSVFACTDVGMHRSGNEDSFLVSDLNAGNVDLSEDMSTYTLSERGALFVVSDGMGGAAAGEIASALAVNTISHYLAEHPPGEDKSERLREATEEANLSIWAHAEQNPERTGMGATCTAVLVDGATAYIAQVGDSRAYLVRGEQVKQLTRDQSLAQMLVDAGAIQPEQAASVPQNVIMQALGTQPSVRVAMSTVELRRDDSLLLCSDGLSNKVTAHEMKQALQQSDDLAQGCKQLIALANERGGEDNITVLIARLDGEGLEMPAEGETITASLAPLTPDHMVDRFDADDEMPTPRDFPPITFAMPAPAVAPAEESPTKERITASLEETAESAYDWPEDEQAGGKKNYLWLAAAVIFATAMLAGGAYLIYRQLTPAQKDTSTDAEQPDPAQTDARPVVGATAEAAPQTPAQTELPPPSPAILEGYTLLHEGKVSLNEEWTIVPIGPVQGNILIVISGEAFFSAGGLPVTADGEKGSQYAGEGFPAPEAPRYCALIKENEVITKAGSTRSIFYMKETTIEIGPNERKEELADNKGEWSYKVYKEKKPETAPPSGSSPTPN